VKRIAACSAAITASRATAFGRCVFGHPPIVCTTIQSTCVSLNKAPSAAASASPIEGGSNATSRVSQRRKGVHMKEQDSCALAPDKNFGCPRIAVLEEDGMKAALFIGGTLVMGLGIVAFGHPQRVPENLGSPVNTASNETQVALTYSGRSLYIVTNRAGGLGANDIWVSQRAHPQAPWGEPFNLGPLINGAGNESSPTFTPDDLCMFYASPGASLGGGQRIFVTCRTDPNDDRGWQIPVKLGANVNGQQFTSDPFYFVNPVSGQATLYFASQNRPGAPGDFDLFKSDVGPDGQFLPAVEVTELNTPFRETHPWLHQNGLILVFSSNRPGGFGGLDLWVSTRPSTADAWRTPCNLGPAVNTGSDDRAPSLSHFGNSLYFASNRAGGLGGDDLYLFSPVMPTIAQVCGDQ
jgi:Tol biopolymer transport system component